MSAPAETILTNARIVLRDRVIAGTLAIAGARIAAVEAGVSRSAAAIDLAGDLLLPGIVDIHTDNLERHLEPRPGVQWPNMAALLTHDRQMAAAGVTTVFDSLCVGELDSGSLGRREGLVNCLHAMEEAQAQGLLKVEHLLHLRCEVSAAGVVEAFGRFVEDPLVRLVSVMDHTPGQRQWSDIATWRRFYRAFHTSEAELDRLYERRSADHQRYARANRGAIVSMCRARGLAIASHDDTTLDHVAQAAAEGIAISEFPTTLDAARLARERRMAVVMGAPNVVLGGSHCGNVSARALAADGLVDGLASDYVPISLIDACRICRDTVGLSLPEAVAIVTANPAAMVGLDDRGVIAPGARADLIRVQEVGETFVIRTVWSGGRVVA